MNRNAGCRRWIAAIASGQNGLSLGGEPSRGPRAVAPGPLDDLRLQQHRHVAADAVAAVGDRAQLADPRLAEAGVAVVELERVRPAVEVGIAAVGQDRVGPPRAGSTRA